jgi:hypothetical protein
MFTLGQIGLTIAYVVLAALVLNLNLHSKWSWQIKVGCVIVVSGFYLASYYSVAALLGWPTAAQLPQRFNLHAVQVREPDKISREDGEIYLWISGVEDDGGQTEPRAYRLPYSLPLHNQVDEAATKLRREMPQLGELVEDDDRASLKMSDPNRTGLESTDIRFYDLPAPVFPEK